MLTVVVAAGGAASFRKLGILQRLPEQWHSPLKAVHRNVRPAAIAGTAACPLLAEAAVLCRLDWLCGW